MLKRYVQIFDMPETRNLNSLQKVQKRIVCIGKTIDVIVF